jgi:alpha-1,6-mannosyltransferase
LFNTWKNGSVAYGVSPWHAYFTSLIPRMAPIGSLLSVGALIVRPRGALRILFPAVFFVGMYSFLPHKEWRFVIYVLPLLNTAGALLVAQGSFPKVLRIIVVIASIGLFCGSFARALASSFNYPGGEALHLLHSLPLSKSVTSVHIDVYTAMTGASRFLQTECPPQPWSYTSVTESPCFIVYNKSETLQDFTEFSHLVTHEPKKHSRTEWSVAAEIQGFTGINRDWKGYIERILHGECSSQSTSRKMLLCLLPIRTEPLVWILERKH